MEASTQIVETGTLTTRDPFDTLFPIAGETLAAIRQDMESNGFDPVFPIVVWEEEAIVVDGHTRFTAARDLGLEQVPVVMKSFDNEDDALLYSFHIQRNRRNMSDEDILKCLALLDNIHGQGEDGEGEEAPKKTRKAVNEERAKELGISPAKVDKARKVLEHGDQEIREKVKSGEKSINKAFNEIQDQRRESGEIKGTPTDGLGGAAKYTQLLGRFLKELTRIKYDGWEDVSKEKVLADMQSVIELIES
ncbi:MAG: ParB N-terminal domain-containing protein [Desulfobacter sp.]|nr:MAG: ParB N-terminal domain-containing protein [Desulfobacter sp.]